MRPVPTGLQVLRSKRHTGVHCTEVQLLSFVCSTEGKGSKPRLWNIQNLGAVPPYGERLGLAPVEHVPVGTFCGESQEMINIVVKYSFSVVTRTS